MQSVRGEKFLFPNAAGEEASVGADRASLTVEDLLNQSYNDDNIFIQLRHFIFEA